MIATGNTPASITTLGWVGTRPGGLEFDDGAPSAAMAEVF